MLPQADILILQETGFDRLLLQIISNAEKTRGKRKIAVLKEPEQFNQGTVSQILRQLYSNHTTLHFPIRNGTAEVTANEILYFEYAERSVYIQTKRERIKTTLRLREVPALMTGCAFASPYISFIVNLIHVEAVTGSCVLLKNGEKLPLSQKKAAGFRKVYKQYLSIMS